LGNNAAVLALLDFVFGSESGIYTSLTFKYGTQQPVHRDVPHFATFPKNRFMGVWHALERVTVNNGPLFYYPGGHKFPLSAHDALTETQENYPNLAGEDLFEAALDIYNGMVIDHCEKLLLMEVIELDPGDVVIWHPQLPHGGMPIKSNDTRFSTVFHCAPIDTQVYQYKTFFEYASAVVKPPNRYDFKTIGDRKYAVAGSTLFM
jgi:ectoine hydroxylase-related dioxygenase (phytanoyl-CoA dioxygenase family)